MLGDGCWVNGDWFVSFWLSGNSEKIKGHLRALHHKRDYKLFCVFALSYPKNDFEIHRQKIYF
jgi:hypothetical protein